MPDLSLDEYRHRYEGLICRWCHGSLTGTIDHYTHSGGWLVAGFEMPQWISMQCSQCAYAWSYRHLQRLRDHTDGYFKNIETMRQELRDAGVHIDD